MSLIQSSGVSSIQGLLMCMEKQLGHFQVSVICGCPQLRGVR